MGIHVHSSHVSTYGRSGHDSSTEVYKNFFGSSSSDEQPGQTETWSRISSQSHNEAFEENIEQPELNGQDAAYSFTMG